MTDDVQLLTGSMIDASGKNEARTKLGYVVGTENKYLIKDCQLVDDRVECALFYVDGCLAASGATAGLPGKLGFTLQDGKIGQISRLREGAEWGIYDLWWQKMKIWAKANRAEEWAKYAEYVETREGGTIEAKLCKEYAESQK
jgi:hypothetical protein